MALSSIWSLSQKEQELHVHDVVVYQQLIEGKYETSKEESAYELVTSNLAKTRSRSRILCCT